VRWSIALAARRNCAGFQRRRRCTEALEVSTSIARDPRASADVGSAALLRATALDAQGRRTEAAGNLELALAALSGGYGAERFETRRAVALARQWAVQGR
jgi:hypothetical protein